MIEKDFDIPFIAGLALREKQIQQNYRPIIAVHKWFARRPGTLFRGLLLAEFAKDMPLTESFYKSHQFGGIRIADPFMGGGTPLLEANRTGCDITGFDINPMAYWVVREEIDALDLEYYLSRAEALRRHLDTEVGEFYHTRCDHCGEEAKVKYFLWVKIQACQACGENVALFPGYLLAKDRRHPKNVLICPDCGTLNEVKDLGKPGFCTACGEGLAVEGPARRNRCPCPHCNTVNRYPDPEAGPPRHRLFAIEYHCKHCRPHHKGRFFKQPDAADLARVQATEDRWRRMRSHFVPEDPIPSGDESTRLHRWGYRHYRETFNARQLLGLELSARRIAAEKDERVRRALATNLSDLLRYQNMLCRYDTMALKSLDIFSIHGFPVGLIEAESNLLGIPRAGKGLPVGSGGWANIINKYAKAKAYCKDPFEIRHIGKQKRKVPIKGEWIGERLNGAILRDVALNCGDAAGANFPDGSLDAVFTDPPYAGNVQYAELMDYCYVWLRRLVNGTEPAFIPNSTRHAGELTSNISMQRDLGHFTEGLSQVFQRMARALKLGAPLAFTYHHNKLEAYYPVAVAILDAGLVCSASLPSPAEMGASIHINGTGSSIVDTVFVCRATGRVPRAWVADTPETIAELVKEDIASLEEGGVKATQGDTRCIAFGHLTRLAVWQLKGDWERTRPIQARLAAIATAIEALGGYTALEPHLFGRKAEVIPLQQRLVQEEQASYGPEANAIAF